MRNNANIVSRLLGVLLLTAGILKGWQLITEPVANNDIWSYRPFLVFQVEFELALGIWLISGLFRKLSWLAALCCFGLFSIITFYKAITGAESCGCFGKIHVNPWITLLAIDLPGVIALLFFRAKGMKLWDWPGMKPMACFAVFAIFVLALSTTVLVLNEPANITASYEVLEPQNWVGQRLPIIDQIDLGDEITGGTWLIMMFHHDCPTCAEAIPMYKQIMIDLAGGDEIIKMAMIEMPPYGEQVEFDPALCKYGRLADIKEWFVTTPVVAILHKGKVIAVWEGHAPDMDVLLEKILAIDRKEELAAVVRSNNHRIRLLSNEYLAELSGGVVYCCETGEYCSCNQDDCRNLACQKCWDVEGNLYLCRGSENNLAVIEECWKTDVRTNSCDVQKYWIETECMVNIWNSVTCDGDPDSEEHIWMAADCM